MSATVRGTFPASKMSVDLNIADLCSTGFYFCKSCQRVTELDHAGDYNQCCAYCGSWRVKWHPPVSS